MDISVCEDIFTLGFRRSFIVSLFLELSFDKGNNIKFTHLVRELEPAGVMMQNKVGIAIMYLKLVLTMLIIIVV